MSNLWAKFEKDSGKYCNFVPVEDFDFAIHISLKYNYLYTATPKVACSTIKSILQKIELNNPKFYRSDFEDIHNRNYSPLLKPSQVGNVDKFIANQKPFKFCFSRNPYSRLLSVYLDKINSNRSQKRDVLLHLGKDASRLNQYISFEEFINVVSEQPVSNMNPHWRIQYYQTFQESIEYDFIGKIENFTQDLHFVLNKFKVNYSRFRSNEKRHATGAHNLLSKFYTPKLLKAVQEKFAIDFNHFGYAQ